MDKFPDDPLDALNFSIDDDEIDLPPKKALDKDRAATLFGIADGAKKIEPSSNFGAGGDTGEYTPNVPPPRKRGGSGDWLGLRDPSPLNILNDDLVDSSISTKVKPQSAKAPDPPRETSTIRAKTAEPGGDPAGKASEPALKPPTRRRQNILDDLFGESSFTKEKDKPKPSFGVTGGDADRSGTLQKKESKEEFTYLPSLSERRRLGDKKTPTTPKSSELGEWLQDTKEKPRMDPSKDLQRTSTPKSTSSNPTKKALPRDSGNGLPSWLSSGFNDPPILPDTSNSDMLVPTLSDSGNQQTPQTVRQEISSEQIIQETSVLTSQAQQYQGQQHVQSNPPQVAVVPTPFAQSAYFPVVPPMTGTMDPIMIGQLNDMHAQIGAAMAKHHQNLQSYMQAILFEAQRVGLSDTHLPSNSKKIGTDEDETMDDQEEQSEVEIKKDRKTRSRKDAKSQKIKRLELEIQEMEIEISKLELKVAQLELKNGNIEDVKTWEIESLKKTHGFEIVAWESRYERAKENFEEISKEYEDKIAKLKKKIEELEAQHKERVEALQAERMSDLEKLGEFHRVALEQAASITLPHISGVGPMRLPMKILQKPEDETELGDRESALLEKEKHLEILRQSLEMEKSNLDEAKEKEKIKKEERDREMRRMKMEVQLKDEMMTKEYERKKDQMEALQKQIEKMREDALKEQAELTREKLELAAEKAKLGAAMSLERGSESPQLQPLDMMRAKAELEAALEAAREAREAADRERRRHIELRKSVEETEWGQKDKEQELSTRERHVSNMLKEIEAKRSEATAAFDKAQILNEEMENKQREIKEQTRQIETKERVLAAERMEIARERVELEKKKTQLEILLPELSPQEDLVVQGIRPATSHKDYVDPKALIMRLKAEKDLQQYIVPRRTQSQRQ